MDAMDMAALDIAYELVFNEFNFIVLPHDLRCTGPVAVSTVATT